VELYTEKMKNIEHGKTLYFFMVVPLGITAVFSIMFCLFPNTFKIYELAATAVKNIFGGV